MGSLSSKTYSPKRNDSVDTPRNHYFSQFSLASFAGNLSGRSGASVATQKSVVSLSRPWSRKSRRRWHDTTLSNPLESAKTAWPVPFIESSFLPEFKIVSDVTESSFKILNLISKGAYGHVYKVEMINSGQFYAMKILSKSKVIQENYIQQVKEEVKIQTMCGHNPFIVNCLYYWQNRRQLFIVTEYMEGGDLYSLCEKYGALPEDLCQLYVAELAFAMDFLHNAGVIYRDLKLENVLLDNDGHAMIIDFGLAKWLRYGDRTKTICGTLQYMAPEVFGLGDYGHAVDWWSLGVLACNLLTSKLPEGGNSGRPGELPVECKGVSVAARDFLTRLLNPDPTKRLRSVLRLQEIPFFKGFPFADVRAKKIKPQELLLKHFPENNDIQMKEDDVIFYDFDSLTPTVV